MTTLGHAATTTAFVLRFGAAPTILAVAPGRINLIGEHTDYNEGFVLPATIDREAVCALRQNDLGRYRLVAADLDESIDVFAAELAPHDRQWANYLLGVVDQLRQRGHVVPGFDCVLSCDVPAGMGLSSSAAIECALATGLDALFGYGLDRWTLVAIGQGAENGFVGANTGMLDQFASIFGEADTALLLDCRHLSVKPYPIALPGHRLVVLDTGVKHNHVTSGYAARRADCEGAVAQLQAAGWTGQTLRDLNPEALAAYTATGFAPTGPLDERAARRARFVVEENARVLRAVEQLDGGDVTGFGESLLAGHWGLSRLYEVSCPESDAVVAFAEEHPRVRGARQMGGGFGGCVLAVVEEDAADDFVDALQQDYFDRFGIALEALDIRIGPGARVVDGPSVRAQREVLPQGGEGDVPVEQGEKRADEGATAEPAHELAPFSLDDHPHRRLNVLTGEWVLVSPHRAKRPWQGRQEELAVEERPSYDPTCYLCPGNTRASGDVNPDYPDVFVFDNDFAALLPGTGGGDDGFQDGLLVAEAESGLCRVICFAPDHAKTLAHMAPPEIEQVVRLWRDQYVELGARPDVNHVQIFENKGTLMGCSNPHPHGQIWAQATVPELVVRKGTTQREYAATRGAHSAGLLSDYLEQELAAETRVVWADAYTVAVVPWWAVWPFEVLLAPRRPMPSLAQLHDEEIASLAQGLAEVTQRYDRLFGVSFPYSAGIHQAPTDRDDHAHWHWHLEFKPPLLRSATVRKFMVGYEMFAGPQRDITPEAAAQRLRGVEG